MCLCKFQNHLNNYFPDDINNILLAVIPSTPIVFNSYPVIWRFYLFPFQKVLKTELFFVFLCYMRNS